MKEYNRPEFKWIDLNTEEKFATGSGSYCSGYLYQNAGEFLDECNPLCCD